MIEFKLAGTSFRGKHLTPERSLDGFAILAPILGKIADAVADEVQDGAGQAAGVIKGALGGFEGLPKFVGMFKPVYEVLVKDPGAGTERWMALSIAGVWEKVFTGNPALLVGWLVAAVHAEYEGFLASTGRDILSSLAGRFDFPSMLNDTGQSGDLSLASSAAQP